MNWNTITLYQFQQIARIKAGAEDTVADVNSKVLAVLLNMTERQVDSMPMTWFVGKCKDLDFLDQPIPKTKPKQVISLQQVSVL